MGKGMKRLLIAGGVVVVLLVGAALAAMALIDVNAYKPKIESAAHDATGMNLKINGKISLSFMPLGVTVNDIHLSSRQGQIVGLNKLVIGVELMPLFKKEVKVSRCDLVKPVINITKDANGKFNYEDTDKVADKKDAKKEPAKDGKAAAAAAFSVESFNVIDGMLTYLDKKSGDKIELRDFNLGIKNFHLNKDAGDMMKQLAFTGSFDAKELQQKKLIISNIKSTIKAEKGVFSLPAFSMDAFEGKGNGDLKVDMSGSTPAIKLDFKIAKFSLEKLQETYDQKKNIGGKADMALAITTHGKEQSQIVKTLNGTFSIKGESLIMYTMDLDRKLAKIEGKEGIGFLDLGTAFGLDTMFGGKPEKQEQGSIKKLVSDWKITNGTAETADVAVATIRHRLAMKGKVNMVTERYENLVIAVLDDKGCSTMKQTLSGPLKKPKVETKEALKNVTKAIGGLFGFGGKKKEEKPAEAPKCDAFYSGSVPHPKVEAAPAAK